MQTYETGLVHSLRYELGKIDSVTLSLNLLAIFNSFHLNYPNMISSVSKNSPSILLPYLKSSQPTKSLDTE